MIKGWRQNSLNQYKVYLNRWLLFCQLHKADPLQRNDILALKFLNRLHKQRYSYSAINTARSALSILFDTPNPSFGESPMTKRFMRAMYNIKPNLPKYNSTWDVNIVLKYLEKQSPLRFLSLEQLSHKLITLLALITSQRIQSLHALNLDHCLIENNKIVFSIQTLLKHSKPTNKTSNNIVIQAYEPNRKVCPVFVLKNYIKRTEKIRKQPNLFLNTMKPHAPVSKDTLSRWVKKTMNKAGIDTTKYSSHSTRSASTSAAAKTDLDISTIIKAASWTNVGTFKRFYNKEIKETTLGSALLQKF